MTKVLFELWEENEGELAVADSYEKLIDYLFEDDWLCSIIPDEFLEKYKDEKILWKKFHEYLISMTSKEFNKFNQDNDGTFEIHELPFENGFFAYV